MYCLCIAFCFLFGLSHNLDKDVIAEEGVSFIVIPLCHNDVVEFIHVPFGCHGIYKHKQQDAEKQVIGLAA